MTIEEEYILDSVKEGRGKVTLEKNIRQSGDLGNREESLGTRYTFSSIISDKKKRKNRKEKQRNEKKD